MDDSTIMYPASCRKNIRTISGATGVSIETAYAMMLMTATLMDLRPEDEQVAEMIILDCGMEVA